MIKFVSNMLKLAGLFTFILFVFLFPSFITRERVIDLSDSNFSFFSTVHINLCSYLLYTVDTLYIQF